MSLCKKEASKCSLKWTPTSATLFEHAEENMYKVLKNKFEMRFTAISNNHVIRSIKIGEFNDHEVLPLVLIHGFAAGSAFWVCNMDALAAHRNVYAIDLLGFARSSRPTFPTEPEVVDEMFISSIEEWRTQLRLEKFLLCGHSFGGYISSIYTIKYADRVEHLLLDDPWGFPCVPPPGEGPFGDAPKWKKAVFNILTSFNPLSALRMVGPWGPSLITKLRPDIIAKYEYLYSEDEKRIGDYMFHCNAQQPSGETAFKHLSETMIYAKNPLVVRLLELDDTFPITIITGSDSWVNKISEFERIKEETFPAKNIELIFVDDAGHHVHADQPYVFNDTVNAVCKDAQRVFDKRPKSKISGLETTI